MCGATIPLIEKIIHELNCKPSHNFSLNIINNKKAFKNNTQKDNSPKTKGKFKNIINNNNNKTFPFPFNACRTIKGNFSLNKNSQNNENYNPINNNIANSNAFNNNSTLLNNYTINLTSRNEEILNIDAIQIAQNIQGNGLNQQLPEEDQNNEYYYYSHNTQDNNNDNNINNSFEGNGFQDEIISFDNILINNHNNYNNHADTKIVENLITNEIKDINKFAIKQCCICLDNFKNGDLYIILPCIHIFHANCVKNWMNTDNRCPICNFKLVINNILTTKKCNK